MSPSGRSETLARNMNKRLLYFAYQPVEILEL